MRPFWAKLLVGLLTGASTITAGAAVAKLVRVKRAPPFSLATDATSVPPPSDISAPPPAAQVQAKSGTTHFSVQGRSDDEESLGDGRTESFDD